MCGPISCWPSICGDTGTFTWHTHTRASTHTLKHTNYYEPLWFSYMLETVSAHNETFILSCKIILQAMGMLGRCGTPTPRLRGRAFWQVTDSCIFPANNWNTVWPRWWFANMPRCIGSVQTKLCHAVLPGLEGLLLGPRALHSKSRACEQMFPPQGISWDEQTLLRIGENEVVLILINLDFNTNPSVAITPPPSPKMLSPPPSLLFFFPVFWQLNNFCVVW